jgi:hypothetical protein
MNRAAVLMLVGGIGLAVTGGLALTGLDHGGQTRAQSQPPSTAGRQPQGCTNADLHGTFAFKTTDAQVFLPGAGVLHAAFLGDATFDGRGNIVQGKAVEAQNGTLDPNVTYTGTYSVEPDCRATLAITATHTNPPGQHPHHVALRLIGRPGNIDRFYFMELTGPNNPAPGIVNLIGEGERMPVTIEPAD